MRIRIYCKLDGKLSIWDTDSNDPGEAIKLCQEELKSFIGKKSAVMCLVLPPVAVVEEVA